jgi:hypothetical protein
MSKYHTHYFIPHPSNQTSSKSDRLEILIFYYSYQHLPELSSITLLSWRKAFEFVHSEVQKCITIPDNIWEAMGEILSDPKSIINVLNICWLENAHLVSLQNTCFRRIWFRGMVVLVSGVVEVRMDNLLMTPLGINLKHVVWKLLTCMGVMWIFPLLLVSYWQ